MTDVNHVILIGRLTRDLAADERGFGYTQSGMAKANVSIAVNRGRKDASGQYVEEVSYFDIVIWGKTAENLKPYLTKGKQICVDGVLKQDRWQDRQTGENRSRVVINANAVQLLGGNEQGGYNSQNNYQNSQPNNRQPQFLPVQNNIPPQQNMAPANGQNSLGLQEDLPYDDFPSDIPF